MDANKGTINMGNINDKIPDNVGSVVNHRHMRTDVQNMIAPSIIHNHRWKAWDVRLVDVWKNQQKALKYKYYTITIRYYSLATCAEIY